MTLFTLGTSCSKIPLKLENVEWCRDKGELGAHCNKQNTDTPREIPKAQWDDERFGQFCTTEAGFAMNQLFIEQACLKTKGCDVQALTRMIEEFKLKMKFNAASND